MKKSLILTYLNEIAPFDKVALGDNVGELIKGKDEIKNVLIGLDLSGGLLDYAIEKNVDMIITHHPIIFHPLKRIDDDLMLKAIRHEISVVSLHTNYDGAHLNDVFAKLCLIEDKEDIFLEEEIYLGRRGKVTKIAFNDYVEVLKKNFKIDYIRVSGKIPDYVKSAAVVAGSSNSFFDQIRALDTDVFVTGEFKYDNAKYFEREKPLVMELGHYESEAIFIQHLAGLLGDKFPQLNIFSYEKPASKFI